MGTADTLVSVIVGITVLILAFAISLLVANGMNRYFPKLVGTSGSKGHS